MRYELPVDEHLDAGPITDVYDHETVLMVAESMLDGMDVAVCLDCGYTAHETRLFLDVECDRELNQVPQTMRELVTGDTNPYADEPAEE